MSPLRLALHLIALGGCLVAWASALADDDLLAHYETNIAAPRWGGQVTGRGQPFNPLYDVGNAVDGTGNPTLFGSKPHGLVGGTVTVSFALPMDVSAVALTQVQRGGQFLRAREVEIAVDGRIVANITLEDTPGVRQRFPLADARGREIRFTVLSQYEAPDFDAGGWEEVEVLTAENLAAKFAPPDSVRPDCTPLIQQTQDPATVVGTPAKATGHPRTLWTAEEIAALRREAPDDRETRTAREQLIRRAEELADEQVVLPPPVEVLDATSAMQHVANADAVIDLAMAHALSGQPHYAAKAVEILTAYARTLADYPLTGTSRDRARIFNYRADMAGWLVRIALGFDLLHDTMTADERTLIGDKLLREAALCVAGEPRAWAERSTPAALATAAVLAAGYALDDAQLIAWGLEGHDDAGGARRIIEQHIDDDGTWLDDPISQPGRAAEALLLMAECAWRNGVDLYSVAGMRLKRLLDAPLELSYPTGVLPAVYRLRGDTLNGPALALYDVACRRYGDPQYLPLAGGLMPQMGSRTNSLLPWPWPRHATPGEAVGEADGHSLLAKAGFVVLRSGPGRDRNQALLILGNDDGSRRFDALGIDLYGLGRSLLPSPGASYADPQRWHHWYSTTVAHNTLAVDEFRQAPCRARLTILGSTEELAVARAWTDAAYPGVTIDRTVLLTRDYAVDLVAAFSCLPRTFDLACHGFGLLETSLMMFPRERPISNQSGYSQMSDVAWAMTGGQWKAVWSDAGSGQPPLVVTMPTGPETMVFTATGWVGNRPAPLVIRRRVAAQTAFASVVNLNRDERFVADVSWVETGTPSARALRIETRRGADYLLVNYAPGRRTAGPVQSDARVALVRTRKHLPVGLWQGNVESVLMAGGSHLEALGNTVATTSPVLLACERLGDDLLLVRNLAGETTGLRIAGLNLKPADGQGYVACKVDAYGRPPAGEPKLSFIEDPVEERLPPGSGLALTRPGNTVLEYRRRMQKERFRIALERVRAVRLAAVERALSNEEEALRNPVTPGTAIIIQAADFSREGGGKVEVTERKVATRTGRSFLRWDDEGHWLEWPLEIAESGYYRIMLKCCSRDVWARRRLEIDGQAPDPAAADFYLPHTGGWSTSRDDWRLVPLEDYRIGRPALVFLMRGSHTLRLTNLCNSVNLDYIVVASPDVPPDRKQFE